MYQTVRLLTLVFLLLASSSFAAAQQISDDDPLPPRPEGFTSEWVQQDDKWVIQLRWTPADPAPPGGYQLRTDAKVLGQMENAERITPTEPGQYTYVPTLAAGKPRTHTFHLEGLNRKGQRGPAAVATALAPGRTIAPAVLTYVTQAPGGGDGRYVLIQWKHAGAENLKGFRLYMDNKILADESTLPVDARQWTTPQLEKGIRTFHIEAVDTDGKVSEPSPARKYSAG